MTFTHYQKAGDKVFAVNPFSYNSQVGHSELIGEKTAWGNFNRWLSTQPPIYADPSIKDGVYKVWELEIVKQHFFMGEWLVLDNNQVSAYIDRGLEHRIYATLKQPVKQEEKPERLYTEAEVKLIATRFARQSRLMNDITSNDTITSFDNWFKPENF